MSEWKCGKCGKIYSLKELINLPKVKAVETDIDPSREHGFLPMCDCGYRFHLDKWRLQDDVQINIGEKDININISTIDLEFNSGLYEEDEVWYETMIFPGGLGDKKLEDIECSYVNNYKTKEEAIEDHNRIVRLLKEGKYEIVDIEENKKELIILSG